MKKVARLRVVADENPSIQSEQVGVRTTGRIKKPKAVFDPSDNYLPRSQRTSNSTSTQSTGLNASIGAVERKKEPEAIQQKRLSLSSANSVCTTASVTSPTFPSDACYICHKKETKRGGAVKNKLLACVECNTKVHRMCLKIDFEDTNVLRANYNCDSCRSCVLCSAFSEVDAGVDKELITCVKCVKSYHLTCHIPNVHKFQQHQKNWKCNKCSLPSVGNGNLLPEKAIREIIGGDTVLSTNRSIEKQEKVNIAAAAEEAKNSAVKRTYNDARDNLKDDVNGDCENKLENKKQKPDDCPIVRYSPNEPMELPDVKYWNVDQVTEFFAKYFPNEAYVFKEHEIDGMSLLLLKRSDVIKKLPIKLGPSLRIYSLILKIQSQLNDPTLGWNCGI